MYPRAVGWGFLERWGLVEGDGRASRDKQMDKKVRIKGKAQRTHIPRATGCPVTWCWMLWLFTSASALWVGSSHPSTARAQISVRKQSRGGGGLAGGSQVPVITTLRTQLPKQAKLGFSFQLYSFFTVCSQGSLSELLFAPV